MNRTDPRRWPWAVFFLALLGGTILGRIAEVDHVETADDIDTFATAAYESRLADIVAGLENCYAADECEGGATALHPVGISFEEDASLRQATAERFTPWLGDHFQVRTKFLLQARKTIDPDGDVTNATALRALLDGPVRVEFEGSLADAFDEAQRRMAHERAMARAFGWGWKGLLALSVVVPLTLSGLQRRQRLRAFPLSA